jgi:hypothetical protein
MTATVRGASGARRTLLPLPWMVSTRWPRTVSRLGMVASVASLTRSPFSSSRLTNARSRVCPSAAAASTALACARSSPSVQLSLGGLGRRTCAHGGLAAKLTTPAPRTCRRC